MLFPLTTRAYHKRKGVRTFILTPYYWLFWSLEKAWGGLGRGKGLPGGLSLSPSVGRYPPFST